MSYEIDIIDLLFHTSTMQVKLQNGTSPEYQHIQGLHELFTACNA